jgi:hypothetical protein
MRLVEHPRLKQWISARVKRLAALVQTPPATSGADTNSAAPRMSAGTETDHRARRGQ